MSDQITDDDIVLASAVRFLFDGDDEVAARVLLACSLEVIPDSVENFGEWKQVWTVRLTGPRFAYDLIEGGGTKTDNTDQRAARKAIERALQAVVPDFYRLEARAERIAIEPGWRETILQTEVTKGASNQLADEEKYHTWNNLRFRSVSEMRVAVALDRAGALFFPDCRCRLTTPENERKNVEPDFLVLFQGKWGILEVDGEPYHPPTRTVQDHARDRLFRNYRILVVEHFDAEECFENADGVVRKFLDILKKS